MQKCIWASPLIFSNSFLFSAIAIVFPFAAAAFLLCATGAAIGTSDAPFAAFLSFDDICRRTTDDQQDDGKHDPISRAHNTHLLF